ncbi:hypothetical protein QZM22_29780 [Burkholderia oklahomensis]|uniref:hypothetical protein n=1 Tax=Burkholderia oklahomensis TaxID=342113 RepID=UPI002652B289|nr:hypothetical protein [Burkholderia oklahomensis]MDN7676559.1 hypothetical protein [Burkholderia oklahomensis]
MKRLVVASFLGIAFGAHAAQGIDVIVCGSAASSPASAGQTPCMLSDGSVGVQQVTHLTLVNGSAADEVPMHGGATAGLKVGAAMLLVLAIAYGLRALRRFLESASES